MHATGSLEGLLGLAKHHVDDGDEFLDIQASVFIADPPKLKLISGWDSHFDKLIYEQLNHARLVRVWTLIIVLKDADGNIISDWMHLNRWGEDIINGEYTEQIEGREISRFNIDIFLDTAKIEHKYGSIFIERIGRVEAAHRGLTEGITREIRERYVYEVASRANGPHFIYAHSPRRTGLGLQAIKEKRPLVLADIVAGQAINYLQTANPTSWALGITAMAAFPIITGDNYGVLYIGFAKYRCLTEHEYNVIDRFLDRAIQAIRTLRSHRDALDENRRLTNLNSIALRLVRQQPDPLLLTKICGNTLSILAADVVTMHEYSGDTKEFLESAVAGRCRNPTSVSEYRKN